MAGETLPEARTGRNGRRPDASENNQISPSTIVRAARLLVAVHTSRQSCYKVDEAQIFTPVGESSGNPSLEAAPIAFASQLALSRVESVYG